MILRKQITQPTERYKFFGQYISIAYEPCPFQIGIIMPHFFNQWFGDFDDHEVIHACDVIDLPYGRLRPNKLGVLALHKGYELWDEALYWALNNPQSIYLLHDIQKKLNQYGHQWDMARHILQGLYMPNFNSSYPPSQRHEDLITALSAGSISLDEFKSIAGIDFDKRFNELRHAGYKLHLEPIINKDSLIQIYINLI